jgi:thiol-disulfide isomerase/thioredoxin
MTSLKHPVFYLQNDDLDDNGDILNSKIPTDIPMVVIVQASWCGHCTTAKPHFQKFADETEGDVYCCTIQKDGVQKGESELGGRVSEFDDSFKGFPHYMLYRGGKRVEGTLKNREIDGLHDFVK